jgi:hypothetical protein
MYLWIYWLLESEPQAFAALLELASEEEMQPSSELEDDDSSMLTSSEVGEATSIVFVNVNCIGETD